MKRHDVTSPEEGWLGEIAWLAGFRKLREAAHRRIQGE
jgi:hypothetical protein